MGSKFFLNSEAEFASSRDLEIFYVSFFFDAVVDEIKAQPTRGRAVPLFQVNELLWEQT